MRYQASKPPRPHVAYHEVLMAAESWPHILHDFLLAGRRGSADFRLASGLASSNPVDSQEFRPINCDRIKLRREPELGLPHLKGIREILFGVAQTVHVDEPLSLVGFQNCGI